MSERETTAPDDVGPETVGEEYGSLGDVVPAEEAARASAWVDALVDRLAGEGREVGLAFCSDEQMKRANRSFRGKDSATDVLSFPGEATPDGNSSIGDVLISIDTARRQAEEAGLSLSWELQCLILHGVLHCLGYDHDRDDGEMDAKELELRDSWVDESATWRIPASSEVAESQTSASHAPRFGRVALLGRPNAGKSTLMNRWLGEKLSIVSDKPQTTRHRIEGILTGPRGQMVFLDTPGIHKPKHRLNRRMLKAATDALSDADVLCLLVDASVPFGGGDRYVIEMLQKVERPKIVFLNKIDKVKKSRLLPLIAEYSSAGFDPVIPISALDGDGADEALDVVWSLLPEGEAQYDPDLLTELTERFLVAERIREKVLERTRDELPFVVATVVDDWQEREGGALYLAVSLLVERPGQKKILIGKGGQVIRSVGMAARADLEEFLDRKVFLDLVVREQRGWREDRDLIGRLENYQLA